MSKDRRHSPTPPLGSDRYTLADALGWDGAAVVDSPTWDAATTPDVVEAFRVKEKAGTELDVSGASAVDSPTWDAVTTPDVAEAVTVKEQTGIALDVPGARRPLDFPETWHASLENLVRRQHRELEAFVEELLCGRRTLRKVPEAEPQQPRLTAHGAFQPDSGSADAQCSGRSGGSPLMGTPGRGASPFRGGFQTNVLEANVGARRGPAEHPGDHVAMLAEDADSSVGIVQPKGGGGGLGDTFCQSAQQSPTNSPRMIRRTSGMSDDTVSFHSLPRDSQQSDGAASDLQVGPRDTAQSDSTSHTYLALARQEDEFTRHDREFIRTSCRLSDDEVLETSSKKGIVGYLQTLLEWKVYKAGLVAFVMMDAIFTGWEVQSLAVFPDYEGDDIFILTVEIIFVVVFTLEMSIRFIVHRLRFFTGDDMAWNCMDLIIVLAMLVDGVVSRVQESSGVANTASNVRVMRILRMVRIVRVIRVLKFFSELRTLLTCILNCFWSLSWTLLVLLLMFYIFGLCLTQGCADFFLLEPDLRDEPQYARLIERFGSLDVSVLSLFEAVANGVSWGELVDTLSPLPWWYTAIFLVYVFVSIFAVLNIVTGVFVHGAMARAQADRESLTQDAMHSRDMYLRDMQLVFNEMDTSGSGAIDRFTFQVAMRDERTRAFLDAHGLAWQDVNLLFSLIDRDGSGTIDCAEFLCGCLKFRGKARSLELALVHFQLKWVMRNQGMLCHALSKCSALRDGFVSWRPNNPEAMTSVHSETLQGLDDVYMYGTPTLPRCRWSSDAC